MNSYYNKSAKILYIGKSNKRFTHNKVYDWWGNNEPSGTLFMNVKTSNNVFVRFTDGYCDYFNTNFKFINENEYTKHIRKNKLKKILARDKKD